MFFCSALNGGDLGAGDLGSGSFAGACAGAFAGALAGAGAVSLAVLPGCLPAGVETLKGAVTCTDHSKRSRQLHSGTTQQTTTMPWLCATKQGYHCQDTRLSRRCGEVGLVVVLDGVGLGLRCRHGPINI